MGKLFVEIFYSKFKNSLLNILDIQEVMFHYLLSIMIYAHLILILQIIRI